MYSPPLRQPRHSATDSGRQCILRGGSGLGACGRMPERSDQVLELRVLLQTLQIVAHQGVGVVIPVVDVFIAIDTWNKNNAPQMMTIQLMISPGFNSPDWSWTDIDDHPLDARTNRAPPSARAIATGYLSLPLRPSLASVIAAIPVSLGGLRETRSNKFRSPRLGILPTGPIGRAF